MTRDQYEHKTPPTWDIMVRIWKRWRSKSDIDRWQVLTDYTQATSLKFSNNAELTFQNFDMSFFMKTEYSEDDVRKMTNQAADMFLQSYQDFTFQNILYLQNIIDATDEPKHPVLDDTVYRWEGIPMNIQVTEANETLNKYRFISKIGVGL